MKKTKTAANIGGLFFFSTLFINAIGEMVCLHIENPLIYWLLSKFFFILPSIIYLFFPWHKNLHVNKVTIKDISTCISFLILSFPFCAFLNQVSSLLTGNAVNNMDIPFPFFISILLIGIITPICEELVFRGVLLREFSTQNSKLSGILISSIFFGLYHMNFNQLMYAFFMGIIMSLLVFLTGSLVSSIIFHSLFNIANIIILYYTTPAADSSFFMLVVLAVMSIAFLIIFTLLYKQRIKLVFALEDFSVNPFKRISIYGYISIAICILLIFASM